MRDRFLTGILIGIGVLVAAALILFFVRQGKSSYVSDNSPSGTLQNYLTALERRDYDRAYQLLADSPGKPDRSQFDRAFLTYQSQAIADISVELGPVRLDHDNQVAVVQLNLLHGSPDVFANITRESATAALVFQNGAWKVSEAPYPYWDPGWNLSPNPIKQPTGPTPAPAP